MHFHSELFDHFYPVTIGTDHHQTCHKMRVKDKRTATDTVKGLMLDLQGSFSEAGRLASTPPPPSFVRPRVNRGLQSLRCAFEETYVCLFIK